MVPVIIGASAEPAESLSPMERPLGRNSVAEKTFSSGATIDRKLSAEGRKSSGIEVDVDAAVNGMVGRVGLNSGLTGPTANVGCSPAASAWAARTIDKIATPIAMIPQRPVQRISAASTSPTGFADSSDMLKWVLHRDLNDTIRIHQYR